MLLLIGDEGKRRILQAVGGSRGTQPPPQVLEEVSLPAIELAVHLFEESFQKTDYLQVLESIDHTVLPHT
jgi:hypothetical protein